MEYNQKKRRKVLKSIALQQVRNRYPLLLFLCFYLLWTLFTYQDFGETWDESGVYTRGIVLFHYLTGDHPFQGMIHKSVPDDGLVIYNHLYSMALSLLNPAGDVDVYHWLNMAFAVFLLVAAYELLLHRYRRPWVALGGPLFILWTPRFLGDIPANPKDMPFAVIYFVSLAAIYFFNIKPKTHPIIKCLVLGFLFGLAQCARVLGLTLLGVYFLFEFYSYFLDQRKFSTKTLIVFLKKTPPILLAITILSHLLLVFTWPYLKSGYPAHLWEILAASKNFFWQNNVLFMGREIPSTALPLSYLPVWILVTTPLFTLFFLGGAFFFIKDKWKNKLFILLVLSLSLNLLLVAILRPVLYDGLRHFLFLLPILAVLAAVSMVEFFKNTRSIRFRNAVLIFMGISISIVFTHMARLHPYEYVYFNELIGGLKGAEGKFDNDYWGASYKEAVEWLKKNETKDDRRVYQVNGSGNSYQIALYFSSNMKWSELKDADYYLSCTRDDKHKLTDPAKVIHVITREDVPLNYIFKLK